MSLQGTALIAGNRELSGRIERVVEELDRVIHDLRNYIFGLRPGILADRQLDQALRELGREMEARSGEIVTVSVDAALAARLSGRSADIVQLTREGLSNVARHAQATRVSVRLERHGSKALLAIEDDGVGFQPDGSSAGSGLRNMRERALKLGGTFDVVSSSGAGTVLRAEFPV
jgi:signal transduction histidine kinase